MAASPEPRLDIILPCLDEAGALPWVLDRIPQGARAIVVDNGSVDGSPDLARTRGAFVVECGRRGYGAACNAGLEAATAPLVAFCDCDASVDPGYALQFAELVSSGQADLVVGRRRTGQRGAWPLHARLANKVLAGQVRRRTGAQLRDVGPLRVGERVALLGLGITDRRSGYPLETVVRAAKEGWRIVQRDVDYHPRVGRSKVTGTVRGTVQAVRDMSAVWSQ
ncbi:MAG: glycosyltransferase family 2 protein [Jatrophihabitans sp.]